MVILQSYFQSYNYQQDKSTYYDCWITIQTSLKIAANNLYCKITLVWLDSSLSVNRPPDPGIIINNVQMPQVHEVIHLGHKFSEDILSSALLNSVEYFNKQSNIFLHILSMPTLISEMPYFRIIAFLIMAVRFYHYLVILWRTSTQHGELLYVKSGRFNGELIIICYLILLVW